MHRVLARQLRKVGIGEDPPTREQWSRLLEHLDRSYTEADQDRYTLERALRLSSEEMRKRLSDLRAAQQEVVRAAMLRSREATDTEPVVEQVEVGKLVDDAIAVLRTGLPAGHRLVLAPDYEHVVVETLRHRLFELVMSLLANARDAVIASAAGRVVAVRVRRGAIGDIELEVRDDGVGMTPDVMAKAFERGFSTKPNASGLGLHAASCAARELGGRLEAESEGEGRGARFLLTLPRKR